MNGHYISEYPKQIQAPENWFYIFLLKFDSFYTILMVQCGCVLE